MQQMLEAGVHFGHQTRYWNPKMAPYIYGIRHKIHIINLEETLPRFKEALQFLGGIAANKGRILLVGTKYAARDVIKEEGIRSGMPYVNHRWLGGMLTNFRTIRQSVKRLKELEEMLHDEKLVARFTKKEVLRLVGEKDKLSASLEGIKNMGGLPDALFIIDVGNEKIAVTEAKRLGIPVVGIIDTNNSPEGIDYFIPGNDDALRAIRFYCKAISDLVIESRGVPEPVVEEPEEIQPFKAKVKVKKIVKKKPIEESAEKSTSPDLVDKNNSEVEAVKSSAVKKKPATATKKPSVNTSEKKSTENGRKSES